MRQKDYPRSLRIGDSLWTLKFVRRMPPFATTKLKDHYTVGFTCFESSTIFVLQGLGELERLQTVAHEILHVFEEEYGLEIPHSLIYDLEAPFARLVIDNLAA